MKHCDPNILNKVTNGNLSMILENLRVATERDPQKVTLRIPVIPRFNDDPNTINGIFKIASGCGIRNIHLLPYHNLGISKYNQLGIGYPYDNCLPMMKKEELVPLSENGAKKGLIVTIGG